jgi:hypothetical protein
MRLARKKVKIAFPLTWLVGKSSPLAGAIYYLPALTDGGRRLVDQIGPTNRILVVDNAPMDAAPISIGNLG